LTASTTPLLLCPLLRLAVERLRLAPERLGVFALLRLCGVRFVPPPLEPDDPLLEREALLRLRVEAADFDRDEPPEPLDVFRLLLLPEARLLLPPEARLLLLPEADLAVAIQTPPNLGNSLSQAGYPSVYAVTAP
jgi:hypothetical protein